MVTIFYLTYYGHSYHLTRLYLSLVEQADDMLHTFTKEIH
jgi:hypothetical protein